ncbi:hypothetical protein XELAEV_18018687mg [Xenopus laevis]|uniref:Olfactory receptor n=1 Tax=Xenopus laevis TaxID=8355 RepID=A0A974DG47_XENLA|nr:hypothetical protein XELAEV_18018687mg [Xenopus laevis]
MCVSAILPKLLVITVTRDTTISFAGCILQGFVFGSCILAEFFLLTSMAYDRYVAICKALQYPLIVTKSICLLMSSISWLIATLNSLIFAWLVSNLLFYSSQEVNHFFCEMKSVLIHSHSDTGNIKAVIFWESVLLGFIPFILILISYMYIISAILKIHTSAGRLKTFSSCSSHLTIVILFCGTTISFYVSPETENSQEQKKILSLLYTALVPMLNPLVYSLRNQDVGRAIRTFFQMKV